MTFLTPSITGEMYHVFTRSIAGCQVFRQPEDYRRSVELMGYYLPMDGSISYSRSVRFPKLRNPSGIPRVQLIAYCIMPTHIHVVLKQLVNNGIHSYMNTVLNGYTHYFNKKYNRKGPLWEGRFRRVLVTSDEQLMYLTRYVHLNPVIAGLVNDPGSWEYSSYAEYMQNTLVAGFVIGVEYWTLNRSGTGVLSWMVWIITVVLR